MRPMTEQTPPVRSPDAEAKRSARVQAIKEGRVRIRAALRKAKRADEQAQSESNSEGT